jgi:hypothetical protein
VVVKANENGYLNYARSQGIFRSRLLSGRAFGRESRSGEATDQRRYDAGI